MRAPVIALIIALFVAAIAIGWHSGGGHRVAPAATNPSLATRPSDNSRHSLEIGRNARGQFGVDGDIAGVGLDFVVDTGASSVTLGREDAVRIGLRLTDGDFNGEAHTASGTVRIAHVTLPDLRIGTIAVRGVPAMIVDAPGVVPLLGQDFLGRLDHVSIARDRMTLTSA